MALMFGKLYVALRAASISEDQAREAAEEVAGYDTRFNLIELKLEQLTGRVNLLQWMVGFNLALTIAVLIKLLLK